MKLALVLLAICLPLAAQAPKKWTPARTADGQPDLQGFWLNATITPFERPVNLGNKAYYTKEEASKLEADAAKARVDRPPTEGDPGTYNQFWFDSGTQVLGTLQTSLILSPDNGRAPIRDAAMAKKEYDLAHVQDSWEHMSVWDRCVTRGVPAGMFPAGYNNAYRIVQTPGQVMIVYEMIHEARIIPIDGRPHLPSGMRFWNGDSRGHWEGDTLVVDVTNYNSKGWIGTSAATQRVKGIGQSEKLHVVERFRRTAENTLQYDVTIDDPEIFTAPWRISMPLRRDPEYVMYEYACHEGNEAVENILAGGRAAEKR